MEEEASQKIETEEKEDESKVRVGAFNIHPPIEYKPSSLHSRFFLIQNKPKPPMAELQTKTQKLKHNL